MAIQRQRDTRDADVSVGQTVQTIRFGVHGSCDSAKSLIAECYRSPCAAADVHRVGCVAAVTRWIGLGYDVVTWKNIELEASVASGCRLQRDWRSRVRGSGQADRDSWNSGLAGVIRPRLSVTFFVDHAAKECGPLIGKSNEVRTSLRHDNCDNIGAQADESIEIVCG